MAQAMPTRVAPPCPPPPSARKACEAVDPPDAKKLRVDHGEAVKKKALPCKSKAKPLEQAKPVKPGPVQQNHESDEDDVQSGHGLSSSSRGEDGVAAPITADTGITMDAVDSDAKDVMTTEADKDVVDEVDMRQPCT